MQIHDNEIIAMVILIVISIDTATFMRNWFRWITLNTIRIQWIVLLIHL